MAKFNEREVVLLTEPMRELVIQAADQTQMKRGEWWRLAALNQLRLQGINLPPLTERAA